MVASVVTQIPAGIQRQLLLQSRALVDRGRDVFVLQRHDPEYARTEARTRDWSHVTMLQSSSRSALGPGNGRSARLRGALFTVESILAIAKHRRSISVIHAHQLYSPTLIGAVAATLFGKRLVVKVTASGELGEVRALRKLPFQSLRMWALRRVDHFVVLSEEMRSEVESLGVDRSRIALIPNAVDIPDESAHMASAPEEPFRVLYTGRLSDEKSLDTLVAAAAVLGDEGLPVEIDLVGGEDRLRDTSERLRASASSVSAPAAVHFHGHVDAPESFYRAADAFVLPSRSEGLSNSLLEAMSFGLPCITSDIAPNLAVVEPGVSGLVFPVGDVGALADRLRSLIVDRAQGRPLGRSLGEQARARVEEEFSVGSVVDRLESIYEGDSTPASVGIA